MTNPSQLERAREVLAAALAAERMMAFPGSPGGLHFRRDEAALRAMLTFAREERIRAEEAMRERCALVAEMHDHRGDIAAAIRALPTTEEPTP